MDSETEAQRQGNCQSSHSEEDLNGSSAPLFCDVCDS